MKPRFRWHIVRVLFAMSVVLYVDRINITIAAPSLASDFHLSAIEMGRVLSAFLFGYAIGLIPGGYLADRLGPHRLLVFAGFSWATVTLSTGAIPGRGLIDRSVALTLLVLARFVLGLCEACAFPTFNRAFANWMLADERARASGWVHCGAGIGGAVTPVFIALIIVHFGWHTSFLASGLLTAAVSFWWWQTGADEPARHAGVSPAELTLIQAGRQPGENRLPEHDWYRRAVHSPEVWLLCGSELFFGVAQFVYITWFYSYFINTRNAEVMAAAGLSSLPYVAIAVGAPLGGIFCDLSVCKFGSPWGRRLVPLVALTLSGASALLAPTIVNNTLAASAFAVAAGLQYMAASAYWSTLIDITRQGTGVLGGLMNGSVYLGSAIATQYFPVVAKSLGDAAALQLAAIAALCSATTWCLIRSERQIDHGHGHSSPRPLGRPTAS
jgi:ACS family glucarate transporter-like MFS transporter